MNISTDFYRCFEFEEDGLGEEDFSGFQAETSDLRLQQFTVLSFGLKELVDYRVNVDFFVLHLENENNLNNISDASSIIPSYLWMFTEDKFIDLSLLSGDSASCLWRFFLCLFGLFLYSFFGLRLFLLNTLCGFFDLFCFFRGFSLWTCLFGCCFFGSLYLFLLGFWL